MKFSIRRASLALALMGSTLGGLTACFPLAVGGAVMGGMVATDRRTTGTVVEDEGIELRSASRIREALGERGHVNVTSYNRQVLLTGEVPSAQDRQLVEQIVTGVDNVRHIVNELAILGTSSLLLVDVAVCLAVLRLRRRGVQGAEPPFVIPGGPLVPVLASAVCLWVLTNLTREELLGLSALVFFSGGLYLRLLRARAFAARRAAARAAAHGSSPTL